MERPLPSLNIIDRFILRAIFIVALFLILSNVFFVFYAKDIQTMQGLLGEVVKQFDLVVERNFATWFSSMLLLLNSFCAYKQASHYWVSNWRVARTYVILSAGFLVLSIDDFIGFHEYFESSIKGLFITPGKGPDPYVYIGLILGVGLAIAFMILIFGSFIRNVQRENRIFLIFSIVLIIMSVLSEFIYRKFIWFDLIRGFRIEILIGESTELGAILSFLIFQQHEMKAKRRSRESGKPGLQSEK